MIARSWKHQTVARFVAVEASFLTCAAMLGHKVEGAQLERALTSKRGNQLHAIPGALEPGEAVAGALALRLRRGHRRLRALAFRGVVFGRGGAAHGARRV